MTKLCAVLIFACAAGSLWRTQDAKAFTEPLDPLTPWDARSMVVPVSDILRHQYHAKDLEFRLLAWYVMKNDRGLRVESGLLWFKFQHAGLQAWALADVGRNSIDQTWSLAQILDSPYQPLRIYTTRPTNLDVYEFGSGSEHWTFREPPVFFKYLQAHVCYYAWVEAIGSEPTKYFPNEQPPERAPTRQPDYDMHPTAAAPWVRASVASPRGAPTAGDVERWVSL